MDRLTWHSNVPDHEVNIHGRFTIDELDWLRRMHPQGRITPTFSCPLLMYSVTRERLEKAYEARNDSDLPFYFRFPLDRRGKTLLAALSLKGLGPKC